MIRLILITLCAFGLAACKEDVASDAPSPVVMTQDALGHYCQMVLTEHPGPKGQIHLDGMEDPIFFSQVRDAIAYQRMPEQSHAIAAIYVSDMARADSWNEPGIDNWIDASAAHFVVGSSMAGGMGAPELVPFSDQAAAQAFAAQNGGRVLSLAAIADAEVLRPAGGAPAGQEPGETDDFKDRLRALSIERQG